MMLVVGVLTARPVAAQTASLFGNEWIVPSQQYYKIKITKDALYRIDQQYLAQAGISGVNPQRIQLWRRGRELAIYGGGNQSTLDATTFFEFYGQRNDGKLDQAIYKGGAAAQPHDMYSLYTDTAAYFLTWSATTNGKRMVQPAVAPTVAPHPHRIQERMVLVNYAYSYVDDVSNVYQPWGEPGEGFLSAAFGATGRGESLTAVAGTDSLSSRSTTGPVPKVEILLLGGWVGQRSVDVSVVVPGSGSRRLLGTTIVSNYNKYVLRAPLQATDFNASGVVNLVFNITGTPAGSNNNKFRVGYIRYVYAQTSRWFAGRRHLEFFNDSTLAGPAYYALDTIPATVAGFDVQDPYSVQRIAGTSLGGQQRGYVFPDATNRPHKLLLADEALASTPRPAVRVRFRTLNPTASNFLIISHTALMRPVGNVANPVRAYAEYRHSAAGGRYDTVVVTSEQLYNQFHYGEKSVGAMRNYVRWELANSPPTQTNYLLLLGKGLIVGEYSRNRLPPATDLVPSTTRSGSDNFLSADWENNQYVARMPAGRVSAVTPQEVLQYLNKLKEHEALGAEPWRKNVVHLGGGESADEFALFESFVDKYKRLVEKPLFGGQVINTYRRRLSGGTNLPVNITLAPEVNTGASLITYFGHGSASTFDLNFGDPTEPAKGYTNAGKYPVFLINGCAVNAVDRNFRTLSENWVFAENKGAIGFMAGSDLGFTYDLDAFSTEFYKVAFNEPTWYGKPISVLQAEATRRMLLITNSRSTAIAHAMNNTWLGDPAVRFFAPERPDFITSNADVQIQPNGTGQVQASSPTFKLLVNVKNPGKITLDSLDIRITRTYPTTSTGTRTPDVIIRTVRQAWHDTTYTFVLNNTGNVFGDNRFEVALDYRNRVVETSETNNTGQINFNFLQGGVRTVWPLEFAIVPATNLRLVGQTNDPRGASRVYEMELDTVPTFNSTLKQTRTVTTTLVPDWRPILPTTAGQDSVVWYWRLRFQTPTGDESADWATSSFRVLPGSASGWSQSHHGQFKRDQLTGLKVAAPAGNWSFDDVREPIVLTTRGGGTGSNQTFNALSDGISTSTSPYVANCAPNQPNIMVAVFSGRTLRPVRNVAGGLYDSCGQGNLRFYHFAGNGADNINDPVRQTQLQTLLTNVRPGDYVALISMNKVNFSTFSTSLKAALTSLGAQRVNQLQDGDPYALLIQKGSNPRVMREVTVDPTSTVPRINQVVALNDTLLTRASSGNITSTRIGPAREWQTLHHTVRLSEPSDRYTLKLIGIDSTGVEQILNANVTSRSLALTTISARQYPYLQLALEMRDSLNRTAPQLEQWLVTYQGLPEGIVRRDLATPASAYEPATLAKQAAETGFVTVPVVFQNVSSIDFSGPMKARILLRDGNNVREALVDVPGGALRADSQVSFDAKVNVIGLVGSLSGNVVVNPSPRALPELYSFNNELLLDAFRVDNRNVPPTLDVTFDGQHILNGDIVSPTPIITVQLRDDDRLRRIQGKGNFDVLLTSPDQTTVRVDLTATNVSFAADSTKGTALLTLPMGQNTPLANGVYTLEVQGRDATGRAAGGEPYRITFEVVNESTISNVYPYPNPVTSKTKFVFTLTGTSPPRNMKIQVLTLTGRVVKEIMMAELGPLRIGNNITDYSWDGTDEFGDRLANGTYLYRVILDDPQDQFGRRATAGDKAFKKEWGKLVLLR
ncbi:C25 family cysteine peptidase [Hymenobacter tibetensis]|uniref:C25 family cysteine peptidase n=1 Tax=Hymenobacter tibetensis TaxID=497967 RepID=A0ABY4CUR6_9BACT|nr:C25 family cysteine peptidase [Hymenobacter tibetensis]UOG73497.1 C25 family cysteine peptidase [Hymenobacter tibetensis]